MAQYRILYWKEIPSLVEAIEGEKSSQVFLSTRFQELIDSVAMLEGLSDETSYLEHWRKGPILVRDGPPEKVAEAVAVELEATFADVRARYFQGSG